MKIIIGVTGASGISYALRLIDLLKEEKYLIITENAKKIMKYETGMDYKILEKKVKKIYDDNDLFAPVASGSTKFDAFVVIPASMNTIAKFAGGISDTLITRVFSVSLKEKRKIIIVPRETPLNSINLENMKKLSDLGVVVMPASPGFYLKPKTIDDLLDFIVFRILDHLGIEGDYPRWGKNTF
ncbi:MAG: UbiX family flavin prenyltransferase [Thermoplasmata archaeon]|nr:UbiX family flavin prenyltransferase [Thermoplasmata archaeon]